VLAPQPARKLVTPHSPHASLRKAATGPHTQPLEEREILFAGPWQGNSGAL